MRKVSSLADVQIVLNDLLNWQSLWDSKARDQKGLQIKNAGNATEEQDLVTLGQLRTQVPQQAVQQVAGGRGSAQPAPDIKTLLWTEALTPLTNDVIPPFVVALAGFSYQPLLLWIALNTVSAGNTVVNFRVSGLAASVSAGQLLLATNLTLLAGLNFTSTAVFTTNLPNQLPLLPGTQVTPVILAAGGGVAISIGLVCKVF